MKILYLGGSGIIGTALSAAVTEGSVYHPKLTSITLASRSLRNSKPRRHRNNVLLNQQKIDACSLKAADLRPYDIVVHGANDTSHKAATSPTEIVNNIVNSTQIINQVVAARGIPLIFLSSGAVYNKNEIGIRAFIEDDPLIIPPNGDPYAQGKVLAERTIFEHFQKYRISVGILRIFSLSGPRVPRNKHFAIGNFFDDATSRRSVQIFSDQYVWRSYIYESDLCQLIVDFAYLTLQSRQQWLVNAGGIEPIELRDLAVRIARKFNVNVHAPLPNPELGINWYIPSMKRCSELFPHFEPFTLEEQITMMTDALKTNDGQTINSAAKKMIPPEI